MNPTYAEQADRLDAQVRIALAMGGEAKLARRRASGQLNARERIAQLLDAGLVQRDRHARRLGAAVRTATARRPTPRSPAPAASKGAAWRWCRTT